MRAVALIGDFAMGTNRDHRRFAEECIAMAHASEDANDKALWITLAQSWVRLAEHAAHMSASSEAAAIAGKAAVQNALALQPAD
jgi:hypothetical protein